MNFERVLINFLTREFLYEIKEMNKNLQVIGEQLTEMNKRMDAIEKGKEV